MSKTLATITDDKCERFVDFDVLDDDYIVTFYNNDLQYTKKIFSSMDEALLMYQRFVAAFITGNSGDAETRGWLS